MNGPKRPFAVGCILLCLIAGCSSKKNSPEDATLKDNTYTNRFFALHIEIPKTWTLLNKPAKHKVRSSAKTVFGLDNETAAAAADGAEQGYFLLAARNVMEGASLGVTALNVSRFPEIRSGKDYLEQMRDVITGDGKPLQQVNEVAPVTIASREFYRLDIAGEIEGRQQHHAAFAAIEKGYALMILVSAKTETGVDEVLAKVGLPIARIDTAANSRAQQIAKKQLPDPKWIRDIKLQGISGSGDRRLAIINGRTFAPGDTANVKTSAKPVSIRCVAVGEASVTVTIDGLEGERELQFVRY